MSGMNYVEQLRSSEINDDGTITVHYHDGISEEEVKNMADDCQEIDTEYGMNIIAMVPQGDHIKQTFIFKDEVYVVTDEAIFVLNSNKELNKVEGKK